MEYIFFQSLCWLLFFIPGLLIRNGHQRVVIVRQEYDIKIVMIANSEDYASLIFDGWFIRR